MFAHLPNGCFSEKDIDTIGFQQGHLGAISDGTDDASDDSPDEPADQQDDQRANQAGNEQDEIADHLSEETGDLV